MVGVIGLDIHLVVHLNCRGKIIAIDPVHCVEAAPRMGVMDASSALKEIETIGEDAGRRF
jgi:hypothetical protein